MISDAPLFAARDELLERTRDSGLLCGFSAEHKGTVENFLVESKVGGHV